MPADGTWIVEPLARRHDRDGFQCGEPDLDEFLRRYARQNQERGISRTFVATVPGEDRVLGYYTLSTGSVEFRSLPEQDRRRLPRYPIPVVHLGRLAVDRSFHGRGLGEHLLVDALSCALEVSRSVGVFAVEVVAKSDEVRRFYVRFGFRSLLDDRLHLFLPLADIADLFGRT